MIAQNLLAHCGHFYIDGEWITPHGARMAPVIDPSTEEPVAEVALGGARHVDAAAVAARRAFTDFSQTSREERLRLLEKITEIYAKRSEDIAQAVSHEMGAPVTLARQSQAAAGLGHLKRIIAVLKEYEFDEMINATTLITREPIGVCGMITPWNWPLNQIACKVGPAIAAGCTMILKPSEIAPLSALIFAEVLEEAGVPKGVFNLVNGDGPVVGQAIAAHPQIDMVSFTGSTRGGVAVAKAAADTVKRVSQELGGKSPNIILDDADFSEAIKHGVTLCFNNSGQSCNAPTRLLVPAGRQEEVASIAKTIAEQVNVGDPRNDKTVMGPVVSKPQYDKIQALIEKGMSEGARLVTGGPGRPAGLNKGYYVRPTVFADVRNDMTIAREEIFGPVLLIMPYANESEAIAIANDTEYGLSSYVTSSDRDRARRVGRLIRAGMVHINGARGDNAGAFGGYKKSGNGREWGRYGFEEFLEVKSVFGYEAA